MPSLKVRGNRPLDPCLFSSEYGLCELRSKVHFYSFLPLTRNHPEFYFSDVYFLCYANMQYLRDCE